MYTHVSGYLLTHMHISTQTYLTYTQSWDCSSVLHYLYIVFPLGVVNYNGHCFLASLHASESSLPIEGYGGTICRLSTG